MIDFKYSLSINHETTIFVNMEEEPCVIFLLFRIS